MKKCNKNQNQIAIAGVIFLMSLSSITRANGLINVRQITAGNNHTCALGDDGVKCWGFNGYGQTNVPTGLVGQSDVPKSLRR